MWSKTSLSVTALTTSNVAKIESTTESDTTVLHHDIDTNQQQRILLRDKNRVSISVFDGVTAKLCHYSTSPDFLVAT